MIEYHNLKIENKTKYKTSKVTSQLAKMLSNVTTLSKIDLMKRIKDEVSNSNNPVKLLNSLVK